MAKLFLIPTLLSESDWRASLPINTAEIISSTQYYIVENIRTARRFLKKVSPDINIDELTFFELNKRTRAAELSTFLKPTEQNNNIGVLSEAGCPGVADPGADIVRLAHTKNIEIVPLVGPSSILLSLMASGLNGQNFAFIGYLPVKNPARIKSIKHIEERVIRDNQTQIFIETPYRNNQLIEELLNICRPTTLLCIAGNITGKDETIKTKPIADWKKGKLPNLHKQPAIFLLGR